MNEFRSTRLGISAKFDYVAARLLAQLATQVAALLAERDDATSDGAVSRLLPLGYSADSDDAQEFRRLTEDDLADDKIRGALAISEQLDPATSDASSTDNVVVTLDRGEAIEWAKSVNDIRLVLGTRLDVSDNEVPALGSREVEATWEVYQWLGNLQYSLVKALGG